MFNVPKEFLDACLSSESHPIVRLDVKHDNTLLTSLGLQTVLSGTVTFDETRKVRRNLALTLDPTDDQVPDLPGDLFHPLSGNEIYPWRGFRFADGSEFLAPLGVFRMSTPETSDDGKNLGLSISGLDRSSVISAEGWQAPYYVNDGINLAVALRDAITFLWPASLTPLTFNFAATDFACALTVWGANSSASSDPWQDFINLAATGGMELFFGVAGDVIMRPIGNPSELATVAAFQEGVSCSMSTLGRRLDETQERNGVQYTGNASGQTPLQVLVFDDDPDSPTYWFGDWGQRTAFYTTGQIPQIGQSTPDAVAQLTAAGQGQLQLINGALDAKTFTISPNAALGDGDCVLLKRKRMKVDGAVILSQGSIPLDVQSEMALTSRPAVQVGS